MNQDEIARQYNEIAESYVKSRDEFFKTRSDLASEFIDEHIGSPKFFTLTNNLLDLGCGDGKNLKHYQDKGFNVFGIDSSKEMIKLASQIIDQKKLTHDPYTFIPFGKGFFDVVTARFSLHYAENIDRVYQEINRVLRRKGKFVSVVRHPIYDLTLKEGGNKNYFEREQVTRQIYNGDLTATSFHHTITDYLSPYFLTHFTLTAFEEGSDSGEIGDTQVYKVPDYIALATVKK